MDVDEYIICTVCILDLIGHKVTGSYSSNWFFIKEDIISCVRE